MTVYVVTYDLPNYGQGAQSVFLSRDRALQDIYDAHDTEGFLPETLTVEEYDGGYHVSGTNAADGIYYHVWPFELQTE